MTIQHDAPPITPPVAYVTSTEPGEAYLNFGTRQEFTRHKLTLGQVDNMLMQLLAARLKWPMPDR